MRECDHARTVQLLGATYKCSLCGAVLLDSDIPPPDWELIARRQRAREARKSAAIRRNRLHKRQR